ncbi:MAG TPA: NAD(P)/FAD-dependent oxidoreductase [Azospirillaceae bacterium]|nr:NAD(P)/FAD-dependent oxidoreductase [Azospirillaceae bacterium]
MDRIDCAVIGAGVVGLAVARRLARAGREVVVLEAAQAIGTETSSRNSEVIHAGIYYPSGSLKTRLCVAGRDALYAFCQDHGVEHRRISKLLVATDEAQITKLEALERQAKANGVDDLRWLTAAKARVLEPNLACVAALVSPSTGIIDSHGFMLALQGEAEDHGAMIAFNSPLTGGQVTAEGIEIAVGGPEPIRLSASAVINSAGLSAQAVAASIDGMPADHIPPRRLAKGNYFALANGQAPFSRLIYPVPEDGGLGVHLTVDLGGQARFGPDVEWCRTIDYAVDPTRGLAFYDSIRRYWPGLPDGALVPAYSGIRPKISGPGEPATDFLVQGPEEHGVAGLVNLFGIESPGLTAALAIADLVAERLAA